MNKGVGELNWTRLLEITGFIIVWVAIVAFVYLRVNLGYSLSEIYYIYIIWGVGIVFMFSMRFLRKKKERSKI